MQCDSKSSYDEKGIVFLSEGQKNWPKKYQGTDLIFTLFIFWTAIFRPQFVPQSIFQEYNILNINLLQIKKIMQNIFRIAKWI